MRMRIDTSEPLVSYLLIGSIIPVVIIMFFFSVLHSNKLIEKSIRKKFTQDGMLCLLLVVIDILDVVSTYVNGGNENLRYATASLGYFLRPIPIYIVTTIFLRNYKKRYNWMWVPAIGLGICLIVNLFTHFMFYVEGTTFTRVQWWGLLPYFVCGFYLAVLIIIPIRRFQFVDKKEAVIVILVGVLIAGSAVIESLCHVKFLIVTVGLAGIVFYYLYLVVNLFKIDELTGLFNRKTFYEDYEMHKNDDMILIAIDMNNLKLINDTLGHLEGDKAIKTICEIMRNNLPSRCYLYRMGGDEFQVVCVRRSYEAIAEAMNVVSAKIEEASYSIAYGITAVRKNLDVNQALSISDDLMYVMKQQMKKEKGMPCR